MTKTYKVSKNLDSKPLVVESFGVRIKIRATERRHLKTVLERLNIALPQNFKIVKNKKADQDFFIETRRNKKLLLYKNNKVDSEEKSEELFWGFFESQIRLTVGEFAPSKVFLHAGVVAWKDRAIVLPANSFKGKTTLVKEFLKVGAIYLSDEYAIIDEDGFAHPFLKSLSVRGIAGEYRQVEIPAENFGGNLAKKPYPIALVLITEYDEKAVWQPEFLKPGKGVLEMIPHCLSVRSNPEFTLRVLNKISSRAIICKSSRGEAKNFVKKILEFFETNT